MKYLSLLLATTSQVFLVHPTWSCTPDPTKPRGPFLGPCFPDFHSGKNSLLTTSDENILIAEVFLYDGTRACYQSTPEKKNVTVNLEDGSVTEGIDSGFMVVSTPPQPLKDTTGGYRLVVDGASAMLNHSVTGHSLLIPLELTDGYELEPDDEDPDTSSFYFFVSDRFKKAYIFYQTCGSECYDTKPVVATVDLLTDQVTFADYTLMGDDMLEGGWHDQYNPSAELPEYALETVYEEIQLAHFGAFSNCGDLTYVYYNETGIRGISRWFQRDNIGAISIERHNGKQGARSFFMARNEVEWDDGGTEEEWRDDKKFAVSYHIDERIISTGELLRSTELKFDDIQEVSSSPPQSSQMAYCSSSLPLLSAVSFIWQ